MPKRKNRRRLEEPQSLEPTPREQKEIDNVVVKGLQRKDREVIEGLLIESGYMYKLTEKGREFYENNELSEPNKLTPKGHKEIDRVCLKRDKCKELEGDDIKGLLLAAYHGCIEDYEVEDIELFKKNEWSGPRKPTPEEQKEIDSLMMKRLECKELEEGDIPVMSLAASHRCIDKLTEKELALLEAHGEIEMGEDYINSRLQPAKLTPKGHKEIDRLIMKILKCKELEKGDIPAIILAAFHRYINEYNYNEKETELLTKNGRAERKELTDARRKEIDRVCWKISLKRDKCKEMKVYDIKGLLCAESLGFIDEFTEKEIELFEKNGWIERKQ